MADTAGRALYLAWRPRRFDDVVGQRHVVRTIQNAVKNGTIAHAYLFSGPRGTGKTSMARLLFKAVNCLQPRDGAPCEECAICTSANEGRSLDLVELDAASNRGIDDVRDLRDKINYAPADARYRVYILDEAHQLTQPAWDALLKTLEEPPPHAILVLATTEAHKVPATVLSRCQRFDFHRHTAADIRDRLALIASSEGVEVEPTVLSWLARAARGGMRDAISLFDQLRAFCGDRIDAASARDVLGLAGLETTRPFLEALQEDRPGDALEELNGAVERGTDLRTFVGDALTYLRALLLLRYGAVAPLRQELPAEELDWLEERATEWPAGRLRGLVGSFGEALARFRDPAQLLVRIELALLGDWDAEGPSSGRAADRASAHEVATAYTAQFVPARQARDAAAAAATREAAPAATRDAAATATRDAAAQRDATPPLSTPPASASASAPISRPPTTALLDLTPAEIPAAPAPGATTPVTPAPPAPVPPATAPEETRASDADLGHSGETTSMNGAAFAQEPAPTTTSSLGDAEGGRPLWDDDDGISSWSPGPPAASNRRVPAPTESASVSQAPPDSETTGTKESVQAATSPSIVDGPAAPVPTAPASADTSATGGADTSARRTAGTLPTPAQATPAAPPLDFATTMRQWPELREALVGGRLERVMTLGTAELVDTVGATLVVKVGSGHLKLLDTDQQRRELRGDLVRALGRPVDLRFVDEYVRRERPSGPSANGATPPVPVRVDPLAEAAADPLVQTGLRLFGGPLVRVDGDADSGEDAAEGEASAFYVRPDEDESDEGNGGAVIGRRGLPVRDWYNT